MTASPPSSMRALLLGGLVPVILFTVVEEVYGTLWGLVAGMVFGLGEVLYEKIFKGRVDAITWFGNGMILVLGGVSLFTQEGIWFKLQPAILEVVMAGVLIGSVLLGKPFLVMMAEKQGLFAKMPPSAGPFFQDAFKGLTFRVGLFFAAHAALATWAALYWSTRAWALLKGVGLTVSLLLYMGLEILWIRRRVRRRPT